MKKLKIEYDGPAGFDWKKAIIGALKAPETSELVNCYPAGEHFSMNDDRNGVKITFTVVETTVDEKAQS